MRIDVMIPPSLERKLQAWTEAGGVCSPLSLLRAMVVGVKEKVRAHLAHLAETKHATADRLGARYTGFYADATQGVQDAAETVSGSEASFVLTTPGLRRAFEPVTIVPTSGKYLTIPLNALAYGHSPREFAEVRLIKRGTSRGPKGKKDPVEENDVPAWLLVESVTQPQDRTLFPDARELKVAAIDAAMEVIKAA